MEAHLTSQEATDNAAKAGLMLRGTLADNAANVFVALTPHSGIVLQYETRLSQAVFTHVTFAKRAILPTPTSVPPTPVSTLVPVPAVYDKATRVYGQGNDFSAASIDINANSLDTPSGVAVDSSGNRYIADSGNNRVLYYPVGRHDGDTGIWASRQLYHPMGK